MLKFLIGDVGPYHHQPFLPGTDGKDLVIDIVLDVRLEISYQLVKDFDRVEKFGFLDIPVLAELLCQAPDGLQCTDKLSNISMFCFAQSLVFFAWAN